MNRSRVPLPRAALAFVMVLVGCTTTAPSDVEVVAKSGSRLKRVRMVGEDGISVPWPDQLWDSARGDMCVPKFSRAASEGACVPTHGPSDYTVRYLDGACTRPAVTSKTGFAVVTSECAVRGFEADPNASEVTAMTYAHDATGRCVPWKADARVWPAARPAPRLSLSVMPTLERLQAWRVESDEGLVSELPGTLPTAFDAEGGAACELLAHGYCGFGTAASVTRDAACPDLGRVSAPTRPSCQEASRGGSPPPTVGKVDSTETDVCAPSYVRLSVAREARGGDAKTCASYTRSGPDDVVAIRPLPVARVDAGERPGSGGRLRLVDYRSERGTSLSLAHYHDTVQDMPCWIRENERARGTYACFPPALPATIAYVTSSCQGTSLVLVDPANLAQGPCKALWPTRHFVRTSEDGMTFVEVLESRLVRQAELPPLYRLEGGRCTSVALGEGPRALVTSVRAVRAIPLTATPEAE